MVDDFVLRIEFYKKRRKREMENLKLCTLFLAFCVRAVCVFGIVFIMRGRTNANCTTHAAISLFFPSLTPTQTHTLSFHQDNKVTFCNVKIIASLFSQFKMKLTLTLSNRLIHIRTTRYHKRIIATLLYV